MSPKPSLKRSDLSGITPRALVRLIVQLVPLLVGLIHQIIMWIGQTQPAPPFNPNDPLPDCPTYDQIPVFVDPPGSLCPWVTLEYEWWIVLALLTTIFYVLISLRRLPNLPRRLAIPFFIYLLFLLVFVKPI
ncbi:MAG: hypothetical protein AAF629_02980 [Chloroflexota bacterium]